MPSSKGPTDNRREAAKERLAQALRSGDNATVTAMIREANAPPMPRTEAGKRLLDAATYTEGPGKDVLVAHIDAIEAEAEHLGYLRANDCDHSECIEREENAVAAERARIRAAVEGLEPLHDRSGPGLYRYGWVEARAAVLAILDREDTE